MMLMKKLNFYHNKDEKDEDENGLCRFYKELPKRKPQDFADILGNAMLNHLKEDNNKNV